MSARLPDHIRRECLARVHRLRGLNAGRRRRMLSVALKALVLAIALGGEFITCYLAFDFALNPLPGQAGIGTLLLAFSSALAAAAFHFYTRRNLNSRLVKLIERSAGILSLAFVISIGLMAGWMVMEAAGEGAAHAPMDLFAAEGPADVSWTRRLFLLAPDLFSLTVAALPVMNFYLAQTLTTDLDRQIADMGERRRQATEAEKYMGRIEECERVIAALESERDAALKEREPLATNVFAGELVGAIHEGLAPHLQRLTDYRLRPQDPPNPYAPVNSERIDYRELEKRVNALLAIDIKAALAACNQDQNQRGRQ